ncbi:MAG: hypothetical protein EP343_02165 [Deltaproteobacteria bacterium]|nr:MAG: hypothetical protein EP343_02165 [Deltaproteobacteria bacterium]
MTALEFGSWSASFSSGPPALRHEVAHRGDEEDRVGQLRQVDDLFPLRVAAGAVTATVDSRDRVSASSTAYGLADPARVPD